MKSFNPCFIGNPSATEMRDKLIADEISFNPCFIGNPSATISTKMVRQRLHWFQSLFYWKSFCNCITMCNQECEQGFNPCFIGNPSATAEAELRPMTVSEVSILVLLEILLQP